MIVAPGPKPHWWATLATHALTAAVSYQVERGLTRAVARIVPLAADHTCFSCRRTSAPSFRRRDVRPTKRKRVANATRDRRRMESATFVRLGTDGAERLPQADFVCVGGDDKAHGTYVDEQVGTHVRAPSTRPCTRDPCVLNVLLFLQRKDWIAVAAQVPLEAASFTTAIDLLVTDRATRTECIVVEIKASRHKASSAHACYENIEAGASETCPWPHSRYVRDQLQLIGMLLALRKQDVTCTGLVLRTTPDSIVEYPVQEQMVDTAATLNLLAV